MLVPIGEVLNRRFLIENPIEYKKSDYTFISELLDNLGLGADSWANYRLGLESGWSDLSDWLIGVNCGFSDRKFTFIRWGI